LKSFWLERGFVNITLNGDKINLDVEEIRALLDEVNTDTD
jgi:hypothetical protein